MDERRLRGLIGLSARARQGVFGEDGCLKAIRSGGCAILLLDSGASAATREKYEGVCRRTGTPMAVLPEGLPGDAAGRPGVAMAVRPGGLAQQMITLLSGERNLITAADADTISGGASVE